MTEPAYIPGRVAPRRRIHPAVWAVLGAVVALLAAGGVYLSTRPGGIKRDSKRDQAVHLCEDSIRQKLRSPATAQFSGETYSSGGNSYTVAGNVDAQNGFGAMLRDTWECTLVDSGGSLSVALATLHDNN
jgi:hypothetical protein